MHIPDGFLNITTSVVTAVPALVVFASAIRKLKKTFNDKLIPLMGVLAAFIFAAQMFNFPVAGGTSGHLMGGVLAAIILGPAAATVILTAVLIVQCILFQDGGLIAIGANVFNMAVVGVWVGWAVYSAVKSLSKKVFIESIAIFFASWVSVLAAATCCALELSFSGTAPLKIVLPAMLGVHAVIGLGEGFITLVVVNLIKKAKPEIIY